IVTDSFGCQSVPACVLITAATNTLFVNAGGQNLPTLCSNGSGCVTLGSGNSSISGGVAPYTYQWSGNGLNSNICCPLVCPSQSTTYLLIGTDSKGCQASDTVRVTVNYPPVVNISGLSPRLCLNAGNVVMTGIPAGGTFFGPGVTGNIFQPGTVGPGFYCIRYSYTDPVTSCHNDTTVCINVTPLPAVSASGYASTYCQSDPAVTLTGTPSGGTFSGSGISGNVFNPANAAAGNDLITYTYTDTLGCSNSFQFTINIKASP